MDAPFNYIAGEKIDLQNPKHRDEVINRNKKLQSAIDNGIGWDSFKVNLEIEVKMNCVKCGSEIVEHTKGTIYSFDDELDLAAPNFMCDCCETHYKYNYKKEVYKVSVPKPNPPLQKTKQK